MDPRYMGTSLELLSIASYFRFTTRKKAFVDSFSPSRYDIYVKISIILICHLCQCQEKFKTTLTFIHVHVDLISVNNEPLLI